MSRLNKALDYIYSKHGYTPCLDNYERRGTLLVTPQQCADTDCAFCPASADVLIPNQMEVLDVTATKSDQ